jgi:hypothetical protein
VRKLADEERHSVGQDWMKAMDDLESLKAINQDITFQVEKTRYWEELTFKTQVILSKRLANIKELKSQLREA